MSMYEWAYLTCVIAIAVMILVDAINANTAATRELVERERRP